MENPLRERLRVLTMIESGARAGELRGLQLGDFDLYRKTIVVTGKGSKRRLIPISAELAATVDEYMLTEYPLLDRTPTATDFLWYGVFRVGERVIGVKPERMLSYRGFYEWWKRVEATAGVRHRKPHMTRHTFATDVLDATEGDLYAVKELLGHSSTRVTEVYLHSSRTRTESAVRALSEYRRGNRQTEDA
jgi:integrase/recombinase XerC